MFIASDGRQAIKAGDAQTPGSAYRKCRQRRRLSFGVPSAAAWAAMRRLAWQSNLLVNRLKYQRPLAAPINDCAPGRPAPCAVFARMCQHEFFE